MTQKEFLWGLIPKPETIKPSELVSRLIKEAQDLIDNHETSGGDHFPCETELSEDEDVVWVSQGFDGNYLVYVYRVRCALQSTQFIALLHSDGGVVWGCSGPWATLEDVHASFTAEEGGWINIEHYGSYPSGTSG